MRWMHLRSILAGSIACLATLVQPATAQYKPDDPLPQREDLITGELDNGMHYMIVRHSVPPGRCSMMLHVSAGSLNESEEQRGLAHFIEHLAFNGSENYPPGTLVPYFESIGMTFGKDQNAFTSFDQTVYIMSLPDVETKTISDGMLFLSDVAGRLFLDEDEIEAERGVILNEKTASKGAEMRIFEKMLPELFPGSRLGRRLPIGIDEVLKNAQRPLFVDFYHKWYTPGNITLLVAADCDPEIIISQIKEKFGPLPALPVAEPVDAGVKPYTQQRGLVAADPELKQSTVEMVLVDPADKPVVTIGQSRDELIDMLGTQAMNHRLEDMIDAGEASFLSASVNIQSLFGAARLTMAQADGEPDNWPEMMDDLVTEVQRAWQYGFTDREIAKVKKELISQAEQFAAQESTLPAQMILMMMNMAVEEGTPVTSAAQMLDIMNHLLPDISAEEISQRFRENLDPQAMTFLLTTPGEEGAQDLPTGDDVLKVAREALKKKIEPLAGNDRPDRLLDKELKPAKVTQRSVHSKTEVINIQLENGVIVHYRFSDYEKDNVSVNITVAGGNIEETGSNRAITEAATVAWRRPATASLTSADIRDIMLDKKVSVSGGAGEDVLNLRIQGNPEDLEYGMQLAYLLLTQPVIEEPAFEQWQRSQLQQISRRKVAPMGVLRETVRETLYSEHEPQRLLLEADDIRSTSREEAQKWLSQIIRDAPIEVAIVGDIDEETALNLARTYLGNIPARDPMTADTLDSLRKLQLNDPPYRRHATVPTVTPQGVVFCGFFGVDAANVEDRRLMDIATQVCDSRMFQRIREEEQLVYSIGVNSQPATVYPGLGLVFAIAPCDPAVADKLAATIEEMYDEFAKDGPTDEEVSIAREQILTRLKESQPQPGYWMRQLSDMVLRGRSLDDVAGEMQGYDKFTADDVRSMFRDYYHKDRLISIIVTPVESGKPSAREDGKHMGD